MKKQNNPIWLITKLIAAKDASTALKKEREARVIGVVQKVAPAPEQLEPAIGFAAPNIDDDD